MFRKPAFLKAFERPEERENCRLLQECSMEFDDASLAGYVPPQIAAPSKTKKQTLGDVIASNRERDRDDRDGDDDDITDQKEEEEYATVTLDPPSLASFEPEFSSRSKVRTPEGGDRKMLDPLSKDSRLQFAAGGNSWNTSDPSLIKRNKSPTRAVLNRSESDCTDQPMWKKVADRDTWKQGSERNLFSRSLASRHPESERNDTSPKFSELTPRNEQVGQRQERISSHTRPEIRAQAPSNSPVPSKERRQLTRWMSRRTMNSNDISRPNGSAYPVKLEATVTQVLGDENSNAFAQMTFDLPGQSRVVDTNKEVVLDGSRSAFADDETDQDVCVEFSDHGNALDIDIDTCNHEPPLGIFEDKKVQERAGPDAGSLLDVGTDLKNENSISSDLFEDSSLFFVGKASATPQTMDEISPRKPPAQDVSPGKRTRSPKLLSPRTMDVGSSQKSLLKEDIQEHMELEADSGKVKEKNRSKKKESKSLPDPDMLPMTSKDAGKKEKKEKKKKKKTNLFGVASGRSAEDKLRPLANEDDDSLDLQVEEDRKVPDVSVDDFNISNISRTSRSSKQSGNGKKLDTDKDNDSEKAKRKAKPTKKKKQGPQVMKLEKMPEKPTRRRSYSADTKNRDYSNEMNEEEEITSGSVSSRRASLDCGAFASLTSLQVHFGTDMDGLGVERHDQITPGVEVPFVSFYRSIAECTSDDVHVVEKETVKINTFQLDEDIVGHMKLQESSREHPDMSYEIQNLHEELSFELTQSKVRIEGARLEVARLQKENEFLRGRLNHVKDSSLGRVEGQIKRFTINVEKS